MPRKESLPLSINEAFELSPGDKNNPVWVNGLIGLVLSITPKRMGAADTWAVVLGNVGGGRSLEVTFWEVAPKFAKGDTIEITGTGTRRTEYKGVQSVSMSKNNEVHVIAKGAHHQEQHREERPRDDSRGGGEDLRAGGGHTEEGSGGQMEDRASAFHQKMAANANLYLQCLSYARKIDATLKAAGKPEMAPDHFQACVSTLFITADRAGMSVAPPPWTGKAEEKAAPPPVRRDPPPARRDAPPDEDVPF